MSAFSHTDWTVTCNGTSEDGLPCMAQWNTGTEGGITAKDARTQLKKRGWLVNVPAVDKSNNVRRLDYCPKHRPDGRRSKPIASITLAVSDANHCVPGFAVEAIADLFCMHDPTVRQWIAEHRPPEPAVVLVADPEWVNRGDGTESLTFSIGERDAEAIGTIWAKINTSCRLADESDSALLAAKTEADR